MAHELDHAYNHKRTGYCPKYVDNQTERDAVNFSNYLISAYGGDKLRTQYRGTDMSFSKSGEVYNPNNEKITNFTNTLEVSFNGNTFMGFSYDSNENGKETQTQYMLSVTTESGQYAYCIYKNKEEYDAAVKRMEELKNKKKDEKK